MLFQDIYHLERRYCARSRDSNEHLGRHLKGILSAFRPLEDRVLRMRERSRPSISSSSCKWAIIVWAVTFFLPLNKSYYSLVVIKIQAYKAISSASQACILAIPPPHIFIMKPSVLYGNFLFVIPWICLISATNPSPLEMTTTPYTCSKRGEYQRFEHPRGAVGVSQDTRPVLHRVALAVCWCSPAV